VTTAQKAPPVLPTNRPNRDRATRQDVAFALHRAARYLREGGDRDAVEPFIDEWLDYESELRAREEIEAL
jgi:hypothetical protein